IRINANPFSAEFPAPSKGRIEIFTKPGSDDFHGDLRFTFDDESLNARDPFAPTRAPMQSRNLTGYASGPIVPRRLGFLIYGGYWGQDLNHIVNATVLETPALLPHSLAGTILTPSRASNLFLQMNYFSG